MMLLKMVIDKTEKLIINDFEHHGYWQDLKASFVRVWNLVLPTVGKTITSKAEEKKGS